MFVRIKKIQDKEYAYLVENTWRKRKKISVNVPAGLDTGSTIRIRGEGEAGEQGGGAGDLYIKIYVQPHEFFERHGNDIIG